MNSECCELLEDAVLKSAFRTAIQEEMAAVERLAVTVRYPSAAQRRAEERALRRALGEKRKHSRVSRAVAMIAAVFGLSAGLLMLQPTVRASVTTAFLTFFEDHMSITFREEPAMQYAIGDYTITYIPNDYTLTETNNRVFSYVQTYRKGDSYIRIEYCAAAGATFAVDTEHASVKTVQIGDLQGYLVKFEEADYYSLHWGSENYAFTIKGTITEKEILKIARGIQTK